MGGGGLGVCLLVSLFRTMKSISEKKEFLESESLKSKKSNRSKKTKRSISHRNIVETIKLEDKELKNLNIKKYWFLVGSILGSTVFVCGNGFYVNSKVILGGAGPRLGHIWFFIKQTWTSVFRMINLTANN